MDAVPSRIALTADGRLLFGARSLRSFSFGWLSVILALYLAGRGLSAAAIGAVFTATMVEDALLTMALSTLGSRVGPARMMALTAPLIALGGFLLATAESPFWLVVGGVLGTLSPNGQDAGPFSPLEHSLLPGALRSGTPVRAFAWYNLVAFASAAAGAMTAGLVLGGAGRAGTPALEAQRAMMLAYGGAGLALTALYVWLAARHGPPAPAPVKETGGRAWLGLGRSRGVVLWLAGLQGLDALAGGFVMQSLVAYWLTLRFAASPEAIGALFFGTNLLSAFSFLAAARVAERFGLLNTMVFTHLPSNVLLALVPFMPSFAGAASMLLARHLLSQMDVPTRQAYTVALVAPDERAAAAGFTVGVRSLSQAVAPAFAGAAMVAAATPLPFLLAGGLKIVYDLLLFFRFRGVRAGIVLGIALLAGRAGGEDDPGRRLVAAAARGDSAAVRALLRDGTDPDRGDPASGWTALHEAARSGSVPVARALLAAGATPDLRARSGGTALDLAETAGQAALARVLRAAGARGSGKSIGDTVCVRLWAGEGFCAAVLARDRTRFELRVERWVGCARGCPADALCSGGKTVAAGGLGPGDRVSVEASCLTHTGAK